MLDCTFLRGIRKKHPKTTRLIPLRKRRRDAGRCEQVRLLRILAAWHCAKGAFGDWLDDHGMTLPRAQSSSWKDGSSS